MHSCLMLILCSGCCSIHEGIACMIISKVNFTTLIVYALKKIIIVVYCCLLTNGNSEFKAFDTKQCHVICTMPKVLWYYEYSTSIVYVRDLVL